jgi:flagellar motor switch protein FliM
VSNVLDNSEVQTPLAPQERAASPLRHREVHPYDFRRPCRVALQRVPALQSLHTAFASALSATLSEHLRGAIEIRLAFVEQVRYEDFLYSLGETTCLAVLRVDPPGAQICLDLGLPVIYPLIDRLLGGQSDPMAPVPRRGLTQIEQSLALQIVERATGRLADTWSTVAPLTVREEALETSPTRARLMPADEIVAAARFELKLASGGGGLVSLCVPAPVAEYLQQSAPPPPESIEQSESASRNLRRNILDSTVELRAMLAQTKLRLSEVLTMQAGDVIATDTLADHEVLVQIQGKDKIQGKLGQFRGVRAVEITRAIAPEAGDCGEPSR